MEASGHRTGQYRQRMKRVEWVSQSRASQGLFFRAAWKVQSQDVIEGRTGKILSDRPAMGKLDASGRSNKQRAREAHEQGCAHNPTRAASCQRDDHCPHLPIVLCARRRRGPPTLQGSIDPTPATGFLCHRLPCCYQQAEWLLRNARHIRAADFGLLLLTFVVVAPALAPKRDTKKQDHLIRSCTSVRHHLQPAVPRG